MSDKLYSSWLIKIGGNFFDSFIYSGKLYLLTLDKKIKCLHWDRFINSIIEENKDYAVGLHMSFLDSSALYRIDGKFLTLLSSDKDIGEAFYKKILASLNFKFESIEEINTKYQCLYNKTIDLETLPADMLIYQKNIFLCSESGLTRIHFKNRFPSNLSNRFWSEIIKVSNKPFVQISSASYGYLLLSSLSDGVYQYPLWDYGEGQELRKILPYHCSYVTRDYNDFLSGSYVDKAYLIKRKVEFAGEYDRTEEERRKRKVSIERRIPLNEWFSVENGFFFSQNYLVYCIANGHIYSSNKKAVLANDRNRQDSIRHYEVSLPNKPVLEARVEVFGVVIEYDDCMIILFADGHKKEILFNGRKLTSWRTFPESKNYLNQLHLIFENEIEIHSFNGPAITVRREFGFDYKLGIFE